MLALRIALLPFKATVTATKLGTRTGYHAGRLSARAGRRVGRRAGWRNVALLGIGVLIGLLVSRSPGGALRAALRRALGSGPSDAAVADAVRFELAHAPRTWHLPQPSVAVHDGVATLTGEVAHETAREALERVARTVAGVDDVINGCTVG